MMRVLFGGHRHFRGFCRLGRVGLDLRDLEDPARSNNARIVESLAPAKDLPKVRVENEAESSSISIEALSNAPQAIPISHGVGGIQ